MNDFKQKKSIGLLINKGIGNKDIGNKGIG